MDRIKDHPILGPLPEPDMIGIIVDGKPLSVRSGISVAAALMETGVKKFRTTARTGEPRFYYCGIGQCTDCMMEVDGMPGIRTCITEVKPGMCVNTLSGLGTWRNAHEDD
jgi:predicted molibdopterin-dependent oxidoreductase YjgC